MLPMRAPLVAPRFGPIAPSIVKLVATDASGEFRAVAQFLFKRLVEERLKG